MSELIGGVSVSRITVAPSAITTSSPSPGITPLDQLAGSLQFPPILVDVMVEPGFEMGSDEN
jgi:hypothetical protein